MTKVITLIIFMFSGIMVVNTDICWSNQQIKIERNSYCLDINNEEGYSISYEDNVFFLNA